MIIMEEHIEGYRVYIISRKYQLLVEFASISKAFQTNLYKYILNMKIAEYGENVSDDVVEELNYLYNVVEQIKDNPEILSKIDKHFFRKRKLKRLI